MRRRLIKVESFDSIMADGFRVEGTQLYVLELLMFGFAYSSYYLLVKSTAFLTQLDDESVRCEVLQHPYRFGKCLELGQDLAFDQAEQCVYYVGEVAENKLA
jgi:hypothetical protein